MIPTAEEINKAEGVELDALVAEHVMGFVWRRSNVTGRRALYPDGEWPEWMDKPADMTEPMTTDWPLFASKIIPAYSIDHNAAFEVVAKMGVVGNPGSGFELRTRTWNAGKPEGWTVELTHPVGSRSHATAETIPLAICRAALLAKIGEQK